MRDEKYGREAPERLTEKNGLALELVRWRMLLQGKDQPIAIPRNCKLLGTTQWRDRQETFFFPERTLLASD